MLVVLAWVTPCLRCDGGDAGGADTVAALELDDNEGASCVCLVRFDTPGHAGTYLAVGTAQGLSFNPRQSDGEAQLSVGCQQSVGHLLRSYSHIQHCIVLHLSCTQWISW